LLSCSETRPVIEKKEIIYKKKHTNILNTHVNNTGIDVLVIIIPDGILIM